MTIYYVGPGGNDANNGLSWANRKLTLNGAEDVPVAAGDTVYVGPGVYREGLVLDVDGSVGNIITYIADVTGQNTDGVGGIVRITGSDNDQTATRANAISGVGRDYRTLRGFFLDTFTTGPFSFTGGPTNIIVEDCVGEGGASRIADIDGAGQAAVTFRRCLFYGAHASNSIGLTFNHSVVVNNTGHLIENCVIIGNARAINTNRIGGITVKNCFITQTQTGGVYVGVALDAGQLTTVRNCIFVACNRACRATVTTEFDEDFNTFWRNISDRENVNTGAGSVAYPPLFNPPILQDDLVLPFIPFAPSEWSPIRRLAGGSEASDDFFGITRPATSAKKSWGAIQLREGERDTGTVRTGAASIKLADAGDHQIFIPITNVSTVFSVYARREADYTGTNPQMIIRQPGQADVTVTDAGAAGAWNQLTTTLTPAADPPYVVMILRSLNTAAAGSFGTYFDDMEVD